MRSLEAALGPTFGSPKMLSDESPTNDFQAAYFSTGTPVVVSMSSIETSVSTLDKINSEPVEEGHPKI